MDRTLRPGLRRFDIASLCLHVSYLQQHYKNFFLYDGNEECYDVCVNRIYIRFFCCKEMLSLSVYGKCSEVSGKEIVCRLLIRRK